MRPAFIPLLLLGTVACSRPAEGPAAEASEGARPAATSAPPQVAATATTAIAPLDKRDLSTPSAPLPQPAETVAPTPATQPELRDAQGAPLPQTDELPQLDGAWTRQLGPTLLRAIVADDPELAKPLFFPVEAYAQVKAIERPERDWQARLFAAFKRNVHDYHRQLGSDPTAVRFLSFDIPEQRARWMKPGSEGNKLGYHRVLRSHLQYTDAAGDERRLEVTSLISWRGQWYIVHLNGFK
jgi:hypothetical protein